jgi:hypothetical protein
MITKSLAHGLAILLATFCSASPAQDLTNDDRAIDSVLRESGAEPVKVAKALIKLMPTLTEHGQIEAAQHICNLLPDGEYALALCLFANPGLPAKVLAVFYVDVMNRDAHVMLPALLQVAKATDHPLHKDVMAVLVAFLKADFRDDWAKWDVGIHDYLAKVDGKEKPALKKANAKPEGK